MNATTKLKRAATNVLQSANTKLHQTASEVTRFAKLERVLAFVCLFIPLFLIWFDGGFQSRVARDSISAYFNMKENQVFYFSLTVASMLFVVNGVVKQRHIYNTILGIMLAGVILFNHRDFSIPHTIFAVAFFGGNALVILLFASKKQWWFEISLVAALALMSLGWILQWWTLFWAEWLSFGIIAYHYILESLQESEPNPQSDRTT